MSDYGDKKILPIEAARSTTSKIKPWVQVPRRTMEKWGLLCGKHPSAAQLLMIMVAHMGPRNAIVASQQTLSELSGLSTSTIKRSLKVLEAQKWVERWHVGPRQTTSAYLVNRNAAWTEAPSREASGKKYALFDAAIVLTSTEQEPNKIASDPEALEPIPFATHEEQQLPDGEGLDPPSQPSITGLEPDTPTRHPRQTDLEEFTGKPIQRAYNENQD